MFILAISSGSIALLANIVTIPSIQRHVIHVLRIGKAQGIKDIIRRARCARLVNYDVAYQTIQRSADSSCCETWKTCHHGREFNLWWYSPLENAIAHL